MCLVLPFVIEIVDGVAIGQYNGIVAPFTAENVYKEAIAGASWYTLVAVVGAHHFSDVALLDECLESR